MLNAKSTRKVLCVILLAVFALSLVATSPVLAYLYRATFTVSNNGSTDYTALPVSCSADVDFLIDNGFITTATALDTRIETLGGTEQPHMMVDDKIMAFCPTLDVDSQLNWYLTTGNSALSSFPVITGYGGNVTVSDDADLELGNNFSVEFEGWVDTSSDVDLVDKSCAIDLSVSSGDLVGQIWQDGTLTLVPDGVGNYTNIASVSGVATHWEAVDDPPATPDDGTTYVRTKSLTQEKDAYTLAYNSTLDGAVIHGVKVYFRFFRESGNVAYAQPFLRLGGTETDGTERANDAGSWTTRNETLNRPGGGNWTTSDIQGLEVAVGLRSTYADYYAECTQVYIEVSYSSVVKSVTVDDLITGEYVGRVWADGTDFGIDIDGVTENSTALSGVSVPDNSNNYVINLPYFNYYKHTVNGTLITWYQPVDLISGTTLPDREGAAQNGIITWRSNPAGVSVTLGSLTAPESTVTTEEEAGGYQEAMHEVGVTDWFLEPDVGTKLAAHPLRPLITIWSDNSTVTEVQAWRFLGLALLLLITVVAAVMVRGHLLIAGLACGGTIALLVQQTVWPGWTLVFIIPAIVAGVMAERTPSIG